MARAWLILGLTTLLVCAKPASAQSESGGFWNVQVDSPAHLNFLGRIQPWGLNPAVKPLTHTPFDIPLKAPVIDRDPPPVYSDEAIEPSRDDSGGRIRWKSALSESLLFTGIMHSFNVTTEAGTRDTLNGHWFQDYIHSVGELRGWSDSDAFMAPYVGHPLEGGIFGYILRQNDPRYRRVQLGDGREYWISMLRSLAYSAVWHTQWKIGPISEASIGNVMLHASPGFITLVDTPTLGFCEMLAEDAADRYVLIGLENRTNNRAVIILARSFLNPSRTFANLMALRVPWARDTRLNLGGADYELRRQLLEDYRNGGGQKPFRFVRRSDPVGIKSERNYPREAPIELTAFPYYERFRDGSNCIGGGGSGAARINSDFQVITEVDGCLIMGLPQSNYSADSLFYGGGVRWTPEAAHRISPYLQFMFGGRRVTLEIDNDQLRQELLKEWNNGNGTLAHYPKRSDWSVETSNNGPSIAVGGGLDIVVARPFAWRILNVEYTHSWMDSVAMIRPQSGVKIATQAVVRIGTW